jgi:hypothetical protein
MASLPQDVIDAIQAFVDQRFTELIKSHKLNPTEIDMSVKTFQEEQMYLYNKIYDGHDHIEQGFFRKFLDWLALKFGSIQTIIEGIDAQEVKYITPVDYEPPPDCGKIIAPFANLVVENVNIKPTIPNPSTTTPDEISFNQSSDIMFAGMGYNKTDNKWYYRGNKLRSVITIKIKYGYIYNGFVCDDIRNITSEGWHVQTYSEFIIFDSYLSSNGGKLKETGEVYWTDNINATNITGFNGRGNGLRNKSGDFILLKDQAYFYLSDGLTIGDNCRIVLYHQAGWLGNDNTPDSTAKKMGAAIRPVKNSTDLHDGETGTYTGNDGRVYRTICIGDLEFVADNLAETKFRNGDLITKVTNPTAWEALETEGYCAYDNDENNVFENIVEEQLIEDIYDLKEALHLGIVDIEDLQTALDSLVEKETGKGLSQNDFTNALKEVVTQAQAHMNIENIHLPPDDISIEQSFNDALSVKASWINQLLSLMSLAPIRFNEEDGSLYLDIDENTLAIINGKLTVIGGEGSTPTKLTFTPETGILAVDPEGESEVDLSSLAAGEGVDLGNFVKKTGESEQIIEGDIRVTGEMEPYY